MRSVNFALLLALLPYALGAPAGRCGAKNSTSLGGGQWPSPQGNGTWGGDGHEGPSGMMSPPPSITTQGKDVASDTPPLSSAALSPPSSSAALSPPSSSAASPPPPLSAASSSAPPTSPTSTTTDAATTQAAPAPSRGNSGLVATNGTTGDASSSTTSGGAVGLGWNGQSGTDVSSFLGSGSKLSWYTNWADSPSSNMGSLEYVPQVWGTPSVAGVKGASASWPAGTTNVLSFNEPDQSSSVGGSQISPSDAATAHKQWVQNLGGDYKIGAPAVARGGTTWFNQWLSACNGECPFDFVPFHFYGTNAQDLITYAESFPRNGKPLWITEWACIDYSSGDKCSDVAAVEQFMKTAIDWFESSGMVERWAWFGAFESEASGGNINGVENSDGSANALGEYYVTL